MRESPWRSLARPLLVAAALVTLGSCGPRWDVNNSPPPCLDGYRLCPMTGACQPSDPKDTSDNALPLDCQGTVEIRQGGDVFLPAPAADSLTVFDNLTGDMVTVAAERGQVHIHAPHGTPLGDAFGGKPRIFTIMTKVGNIRFPRIIPIIVSSIAAAPGGDDKGPGLFSHPFATMQQAVSVAGPNDTITLRNPPVAKGSIVVGTGDNATTPVTLPDHITVRCVDADPVSLKMQVLLSGDAWLETLRFDGPRLKITTPASNVTFVNDILSHGLTVDSEASVPPGAPGTEVNVIGATQVFDDRAPNSPAHSPLLVLANGAKITIDNSGVKMTDESMAGAVDALRVDGNGDTLTLSGDTEITNAAGLPAVHITGPSTVSIAGAKFFADLLVENEDTDVEASNATFDRAALRFSGHDLKLLNNTLFTDYDKLFTKPVLTFQGHDLQIADTAIDTNGLVLPLPANQDVVQIMAGANDTSLENLTFKHAPMTFEGSALVIRGSTSFTDSLLTFKGTSLQVNDAAFSGQGIYQAGASPSVATLSNVSITGYTQFGYRLGNGQVTIANGNFVHDQSAAQGPNGPWALRIEAAFDSDSSVTSVATRYDGVAFRPPTCSSPDQTACTVVGPDTCAGVYTISPGIRVSFSQ